MSAEVPLMEPKHAASAHRLQNTYAFWVQKKNKRTAGATWSSGMQQIARFNTVESFWQIYSHMQRADTLNGSVDVMLFRDGIAPMWEDEANRGGGRWTLRMRKGLAAVIWEELLLAIVGEQFDVGSEICGAVLSVRYHDDHISLWNRSADNESAVAKIRDVLQRVLALPAWLQPEYTRHSNKLHAAKASAEAAKTGEGAEGAGAEGAGAGAGDRAAPAPAEEGAGAGASGGSRPSGGGWRAGAAAVAAASAAGPASGSSVGASGSGDMASLSLRKINSGDRGERGERGERGDRSGAGAGLDSGATPPADAAGGASRQVWGKVSRQTSDTSTASGGTTPAPAPGAGGGSSAAGPGAGSWKNVAVAASRAAAASTAGPTAGPGGRGQRDREGKDGAGRAGGKTGGPTAGGAATAGGQRQAKGPGGPRGSGAGGSEDDGWQTVTRSH